jgi:Tfp pilus assembly protein PilF
VSYWRDSPVLFERAIAVTRNNFVMHYNYGTYLCRQGRSDEGARHFEEAIRINPAWQENHLALLKQKKFDVVIKYISEAIRQRRNWPNIHEMYNDLGMAYECKGSLILAEQNYRMALLQKPDYEMARNNLASVLTRQGKMPGPTKTDEEKP